MVRIDRIGCPGYIVPGAVRYMERKIFRATHGNLSIRPAAHGFGLRGRNENAQATQRSSQLTERCGGRYCELTASPAPQGREAQVKLHETE
jgi:hypothetical protein